MQNKKEKEKIKFEITFEHENGAESYFTAELEDLGGFCRIRFPLNVSKILAAKNIEEVYVSIDDK